MVKIFSSIIRNVYVNINANMYNHIVNDLVCPSLFLHAPHSCAMFFTLYSMFTHVMNPLEVISKPCLHVLWYMSTPFYVHYLNLILWIHYMVFVQVFTGDDDKSIVYCCNKMQKWKPCAMLFEKDKYEQVVLEAHYQLRAKVKMVNNMYPFFL